MTRDFFARPTLEVARDCLGALLVRVEGNDRVSGTIVEVEAYIGEQDLACHAKAGRTQRTRVLYAQPGHAYVYFTYGMHWLLNFVTEAEGSPAAVLIRAVEPVTGRHLIAARRKALPERQWTNGPGKVCRSFAIDGRFNGADLCAPDAALFVEAGIPVPDAEVLRSARVGMNNVPEPWKSVPWRFVKAGGYRSSAFSPR
ncbi:MAG: DNA-3-methyladenine glycosylase [bacterium]